MNGLHVSGILVQVRPERVHQVQRQFAAAAGVEVQDATPEGRLVTIVERDSDAELAHALQNIQNTAGVLSASLVYHYSDESDAHHEEVTS